MDKKMFGQIKFAKHNIRKLTTRQRICDHKVLGSTGSCATVCLLLLDLALADLEQLMDDKFAILPRKIKRLSIEASLDDLTINRVLL